MEISLMSHHSLVTPIDEKLGGIAHEMWEVLETTRWWHPWIEPLPRLLSHFRESNPLICRVRC